MPSRLKRLAVVAVGALVAFTASKGFAEPSIAELKKEFIRPLEVPFPEGNPFTQVKAELGKMLFFDPRLSGQNHFTCAMCHNPSLGWSDGLALGFGEGMKHLGRRTPTILNLAWGELLMWDGRFESLEQQALGPIGAAVEMNQPLKKLVPKLKKFRGYVTLFNLAFPGEGLTLQNLAKAIATYERTIVSGIAPFDRWVAGEDGAISETAKRGFALFTGKARCVACHSGWNFTDDSFHDIGLPKTKDRKHLHIGDHMASMDHQAAGSVHIHKVDKGRGSLDQFKNSVEMQQAFKTPGLRNLTARMPYMHDGSLPTLVAVIEHYDTGGQKRPSLSAGMNPLNLSKTEKTDLLAFLKSLESVDPPVVLPILPR